MFCSCGENAVHYRRYEGNYYCKDCLSKAIEKKFLEAVDRKITKDDKILVAFSGGKDSMLLLHLTKKFFPENKIVAVTIDEGIKRYRDVSIEIAKEYCEKNNIRHEVMPFRNDIKIDELKDKKTCTYCGVFRREAINRAAEMVGATKIFIGHNQDDEAQGVVLNFIRGDAKRLGSSESTKFIRRIKPLSAIPEKEVMLYCLLNSLPFHEAECPYSHDNMRRDAQEILSKLEDKYPGTRNQILKFRENIVVKSSNEDNRCLKCNSPTPRDICRSCELEAGLD